MRAIFGLFHRDGRPGVEERIAEMAEGLDPGGLRLRRIECTGPIGIGWIGPGDPARAARLGQPRVTEEGWIAAAIARIDNRKELAARLDLDPSVELDDTDLVLAAYRRWGDACPDRLIGDWTLCLWDERTRVLFLARDHHGTGGLFFFQTPRLVAFATSLAGLLALPEVPREPNRLKIAADMVRIRPGGGWETCYRDLHRLPPAHAMAIAPDRSSRSRYWFPERLPRLRLGSDEEYVEALLDVYGEAVRCRLRDREGLAATLSGGLDSGSVVALAARQLALDGARLQALSWAPRQDVALPTWDGRFGDESEYARATADFLGNVDLKILHAAAASPVRAMEAALDHLEQPVHLGMGGVAYWLTDLLENAARLGARRLLTGGLGNLTVSWPGRPGRPSWRQISGLAAALGRRGAGGPSGRGQGSLSQTARSLIRALAPDWLVRRIRKQRLGPAPWTTWSPIRSELASDTAVMRRLRTEGWDPWLGPGTSEREERLAYLGPGRSESLDPFVRLAAGFGIEALDPTADKRVIELCLSLPADQYYGDGQNRYLIRRAMAGHLPDTVRLSPARGRPSSDLGARLRAHRDEVAAALESLGASGLAGEYLDLDRMRRVWRRVGEHDDAETCDRAALILMPGLLVGSFLRRLEAAQ